MKLVFPFSPNELTMPRRTSFNRKEETEGWDVDMVFFSLNLFCGKGFCKLSTVFLSPSVFCSSSEGFKYISCRSSISCFFFFFSIFFFNLWVKSFPPNI